MKRRIMIACVALSLVARWAYAGYKDGEYAGSSSMVDVTVAVENGLISGIEISQHRGGEGYADTLKPLIDEMIETQSTEVDAVTGATVSSSHLKDAVNDALRQASEE